MPQIGRGCPRCHSPWAEIGPDGGYCPKHGFVARDAIDAAALKGLRAAPGRVKTPQVVHRGEDRLTSTVNNLGGSGADALSQRLSQALERLGETAALPARKGIDPWPQNVLQCRREYRIFECEDCGRWPAVPFSCGLPACPRCGPAYLARDWKARSGRLPPSMTVFRLKPVAAALGPGALKRLRNRFREWRKRAGLSAGIYGASAGFRGGRLTGSVVLAVPDEEAVAVTGGRAFEAKRLASQCSPDDVLGFFQAAYAEEAASWATPEELAALLVEVKGRRRFQGFGGLFGRPDTEPTPLSRVAGGNCKGPRAAFHCPFCGGRLKYHGMAGPERVTAVGDAFAYHPPGVSHVRPTRAATAH